MTLVFTTSDAWVSRTIKYVLRYFQKFVAVPGSAEIPSHVALGLELVGVPILLHADWTGVRISHRAKWTRKNRVLEEYAVPPRLAERLPTAVDAIDTDYDYGSLLGFVLVLLSMRWLRKKVRNPLASSKAFICSELVHSLDVRGAVVPEWGELDPEAVSPLDLVYVCRRKPEQFPLVIRTD